MKLTIQQLKQIIKEEIQKENTEGKWTSAGGVVVNQDRTKVFVFKPSNNYGPIAFPKGRVDEGETNEQAALREVEEETGIKAKIMPGNSYIGKGVGSYSITHYYLMDIVGKNTSGFRNDETEWIKQVTWEEAIKLFKGDGNKRDIEIALKAMKMLGVAQ